MSLKVVGLGLAGIFAISIGVLSIWLGPLVTVLGVGRVVEKLGDAHCDTLPELQACEKMVLHRPSGMLYMSCSTPISRTKWCPTVDNLDTPKPPTDPDGFAIVDTSQPLSSASFKRVTLKGLPIDDPTWRGLNLVGLDVVESSIEPNVLWVYVINHRPPLPPKTPKTDGADSCVEIFRTTVGSDEFIHVRTVEDAEHIVTPNDVVGQPDGSGFWVSNDHIARVGSARTMELLTGREGLGITYCTVVGNCKFAITGIPSLNGIVRAPPSKLSMNQELFYGAGHATNAKLFVMERQSDNSLVLSDTVNMDYAMDNLSIDEQGSVYVATFPKLYHWRTGYTKAPETYLNPSSVHKISIDPGAYFGDKYKVEKIFETNGTLISGATSAVWDSKKKTLWIHGVASKNLVACKL